MGLKFDRRGLVLGFSQRPPRAAWQRGYVVSGNTANTKVAYRNFLTLWKHADPDILILKEAKAEYAKLQ